MGYGYQQPAAAHSNQITKRRLTQAEMASGLKFFKAMQTQLRIFALVPLILIAINILLLDSNSIVSLIALIFSFVIIIVSISFLVFRKKVLASVGQGTAIEVRAPAYRSNTTRNMPAYTVGPITLFSTPEVERLIVQGAETCVACVPQLGIALSVNNTMLTHGTRVICPPNLEAMARPATPAYQQPMAPPPQPQQPLQQPAPDAYNYPPPPPP